MRTFKTRKKRKRKLFIFIFFFIFSYVFIKVYLTKHALKNSILNKNIDYINFNILKTIDDYTDSIINKPVNLLSYKVRVVNVNTNSQNKTSVVTNKKTNDEEIDEYKPVVYIYNTHDTEEYDGYSVVDASYLLSNLLNSNGIQTLQEEKSVKTFLQDNSRTYNWSYVGSKKYINEALNAYPSINYFFDIHRDSVSKSKSTFINNEKSYAKVMFVVGLDNPSYSGNLDSANKLNDIINAIAPGISRGISKKSGKGVNGVYNQDISNNCFLIEIGGPENTKDEVINTINVLNRAIEEYIRGVIW